MIDHADITASENISSALILFYRKLYIGALFFDNIVTPSAGLSACAAVGSSACKIIRQKASA
jgi:hypothetical protein